MFLMTIMRLKVVISGGTQENKENLKIKVMID